jgi:uncharacterized membrane protein
MTSKQFRWAKVAIAAILAVVITQAVILNSYILASVAVLITILLVIILRRQVKEVLADERDYKIAGDAARWTLAIFSVLAWLMSFVLIMLRNINPAYETAGFILSYTVCALLVVHLIVSLVFKRIIDGTSRGTKTAYFVLALLVAFMAVIFGVRIFSEEDSWLCQNGQWVKHGNPSEAIPSKSCNK